MPRAIKNILYCLLSAGIMTLAFLQGQCTLLAWVGLVPLFAALEGKRKRTAFALGFFWAIFFFGGTLYWLTLVDKMLSFIGFPLLVFILSIYGGFFGLGVSYFQSYSSLKKIVIFPSLWIFLEYARAHLFSGFSFSTLGLSQYNNPLLIQIADMTGMFGVSFTILLVNYAFYLFAVSLFGKQERSVPKKDFLQIFTVLVLTILFVIGYGAYRMKQEEPADMAVIGFVQGNIPQELKWDEEAWPAILEKHKILTQRVLKENVDLIVWPETAFPGFWGREYAAMEEMHQLATTIGTPILLGAVIEETEDYYNAGVLLLPGEERVQQYHKWHLVPFGEYLPYRKTFPFLTEVVPIADFSVGKEHTVFEIPSKTHNKGHKLSVVICFEDTFSDFVRKFVLNGAQMMVNLTNDAWFGDSLESMLHRQSTILRAVENRRAFVRAANTGISCLIDTKGRIVKTLTNQAGKATFIAGQNVGALSFNEQLSFYTRFGDVFVWACFVFSVFLVVSKKRAHK